jgi:hypothetical protein
MLPRIYTTLLRGPEDLESISGVKLNESQFGHPGKVAVRGPQKSLAFCGHGGDQQIGHAKALSFCDGYFSPHFHQIESGLGWNKRGSAASTRRSRGRSLGKLDNHHQEPWKVGNP